MKAINRRYRFMQGLYWLLFVVGHAYISSYLADLGYTAGQIGLVTAIACLAATVLQPMLGQLADSHPKMGWKRVLIGLCAFALLDVLVLFVTKNLVAAGICYGVQLMLINCLMPFVNSACYYYNDRGVTVDFGIARSIGSLSYAVLSYILGQMTARFGLWIVPIASLFVFGGLLIDGLLMPYGGTFEHAHPLTAASAGSKEKTETGKKSGVTAFLKKYPAFAVMLAAVTLELAFHNLLSIYLIQIIRGVGGDSPELGTALAIAAVMEIPILFFYTKISRKFSTKTLLLISACTYSLRAILLLFSHSILMIYAVQLLQMTSFGINASATVVYADECMEPQDKVTGQSYMGMTSAAGALIGSLVGGNLYDAGGVSLMLIGGFTLAIVGVGLTLVSGRVKGAAQ